MKKSIKYILFLLFISLFMINIEAKEVVKECYYNYTGVASSGDPKTDALITVWIYDDNSTWAKQTTSGTLECASSGCDDGIANWEDARKEYEKNKQCLDFLIYDTDFMDEEFRIYTRNQIVNYGSRADGPSDTGTVFALIKSVDNALAQTCEYPGFTTELNKDGYILSVKSVDGSKIIPSTDMLLNAISADAGCPSVRSCKVEDMPVSGDNVLFYSSIGSNEQNVYNCTWISAMNNSYDGNLCYKYNDLFYGNVAYNLLGLNNYANEYITCGSDAACISEVIGNYNKQKDKTVDWCNSIMSNQHYNDGCLLQCLKLSDSILELEKKMGIAIEYKGDTCTLGAQLVLWVANVIRWLKYIVPALVVIFGILDFIKATGADKDDEVKKAQGKFVKRLIAAGLVFLIPFIIEFILKIFGFEANGCGIINL